MAAEPGQARALLAQWRAGGQARMDPAALARIDALQARVERYQGPVREQLQQRVQRLLDTYARRLQAWSPAAAVAPAGPTALAELATLLAARTPGEAAEAAAARSSGVTATAADTGAQSQAQAVIAVAHPLPVLESLDESRRTWTRLRTQGQLRRSLEQLPEDAGPLNSAVLAHRALSLMLELGNGYLEHFVTYVDTLASLEQLRAVAPARAGDTGAAAARPGKAPRKPRRRKADAG